MLDGLTTVTGGSRGKNTLVEIHSAPWVPLWFAVFDRDSGFCAYFEADLSAAEEKSAGTEKGDEKFETLFRIRAVERIDADYLYQHPLEYKEKFENRMFGGNEFRIITIGNAIVNGAPMDVIRAFEFHDHYCPGVTSGILMARYLKKHFAPFQTGYFLHAVLPWCKEDALMALLNVTPGKKSYAVYYPTEKDVEGRLPEAKDASVIIYRKNAEGTGWEGRVLGFQWADTSCPDTSITIIDKLCADLWYLKNLDRPEVFIKIIKAFRLPENISSEEWARPGIDPIHMIGLTRKR